MSSPNTGTHKFSTLLNLPIQNPEETVRSLMPYEGPTGSRPFSISRLTLFKGQMLWQRNMIPRPHNMSLLNRQALVHGHSASFVVMSRDN